MMLSLNCLILSSGASLTEDIGEKYDTNDKVEVEFSKFKVSNLKEKLYRKQIIKDIARGSEYIDLWKVDSMKVEEENNLKEFTESDIREKLGGEKMKPQFPLEDYFNPNEIDLRDIHVLIVPTSTGPSQQGVPQDWNDANSIYNWMKTLKRPAGTVAPKLVSTSGANFPLQGREETMKILLEGNRTRYGICERFAKRNETDRNNHPIPLLANGPGTGKSRFLQEIPTLLREQIEDCTTKREEMRKRKEMIKRKEMRKREIEIEIERKEEEEEDEEEIREKERVRKERENDNELLNRIKGRMYAVNVTFGNGTPAKSVDVPIGETSVALRILYEHFISGGKCKYDDFVSMCGKNRGITINRALNVVLKDFDADIDFIVLGIDELNILHSKRGHDDPVRNIVHAVGGLNCSSSDIFYVPILAGTIQGPLEEMFRGSTYLYLTLSLRLLRDEEVWSINEFMATSECRLVDCINSRTFRRCICDLGGQVRALESFYDELLVQIESQQINTTVKVNYMDLVSGVKKSLKDRYPFEKFSKTIIPTIARAILNIPVEKDDKADEAGKVSYISLSSEGILNFEEVNNSLYIRMPYMWVMILTLYNKSCENWKAMINQDGHILWQTFEVFNMKFWSLRLQLLSALGKNVTIQDLFRGACYLDKFEFLEYIKSEFELPDTSSIKYQELEHQYPRTVRQEHLSPGTIYKNCEGAESWDVFFFLDNFLFAIQVKSSKATANKPQTLNKGMIYDGYNKAEEAFKLLKNQVRSIKDWMLFICTNGCKTEDALDELPENCLVVYNENFKDFYGYTFSSRAEFCAANDEFDANTAEAYELRTIKNIGPKTAGKISKGRPYDDEDDLYDKVKIDERAKKKIKVIPNTN